MSGDTGMDRRGFLLNAGKAALGVGAAGTMGHVGSARAQARDVNWIIYQAPGGSIDTTARVIQPYLEKHGVKTNLDYVLGAGGRVARTKLFTARPDGNMMMTESAPGGAIDEVIGRAGYKASEFIPIYGWSVVSWQLCVKKDSPIRTFQQFVDECKKRRVVVATIGRSGSSHIQLAALQKELNIPFGMVHFEGSGKAYPAVMGGHVDAAISGPGSGSRMRDSLHFLGVTGEEREKALPDVPTLKELGYDAQFSQWTGLFVPAGTPDAVIAKLREAAKAAVNDATFQGSLARVETPIQYLDQPQFLAFWDADAKKLAEVVKRIGKVE